MKRSLITAVLGASAFAAAGAVQAQHDHGHGILLTAAEPVKQAQSGKKAPSYSTSGVVKKVDQSRGTLTLAHDAIPALKWPAMTMVFKVNDKALLQKVNTDQKVNFEFTQQGKDYVITSIK